MKACLYILKCCDNTYYVGSTNNLKLRLFQHQNGEGSNYTKERLPVKLVYFEEYSRIDDAFNREKQIHKWSQKKKRALIQEKWDNLQKCAECKNESHFKNKKLKQPH